MDEFQLWDEKSLSFLQFSGKNYQNIQNVQNVGLAMIFAENVCHIIHQSEVITAVSSINFYQFSVISYQRMIFMTNFEYTLCHLNLKSSCLSFELISNLIMLSIRQTLFLKGYRLSFYLRPYDGFFALVVEMDEFSFR